MTDDELTTIEARARAATLGPWRVQRRVNWAHDLSKAESVWFGVGAGARTTHQNQGHFHPSEATYHLDELDIVGVSMDRDYNSYEGGIESQSDAVFIAHARTDVPALVAEVRRLRALSQCERAHVVAVR